MGEDTLFPIWEHDETRLKPFDPFKQALLEQLIEEGEGILDEGIRGVVRALNSHPDVCTSDSCAGTFHLLVSPEDVFKPGRLPLPENPETGLPMFHFCCPLCSQGSVCELQKLSVRKVKEGNFTDIGGSYITKPMLSEYRFDWMPEHREEWTHGMKSFGSPLTTEEIEDVLGGLDVPEDYMVLLELTLPYVMGLWCRNPETEAKVLKAVHSAGWVYSYWQSWPSEWGPTDSPSPWSSMRMLLIMDTFNISFYIPLSNSKESLPPPERLELIVREANAAMERAQTKLPALEQAASGL